MNKAVYLSSLEPSAAWHDSEPLICTSVVPEAPNVATFSFSTASGAWFRFKAGQFIQLELPVGEEIVNRVYTISSSPSRPLSLSVTVKAQEDSIGTRWMLDNLRPGMSLKASGPDGLFLLPPRPVGKFLFISAGSGITPSLSMMTYLFDLGNEPDISFIHCARTPADIIARRQVEAMATRVPSLQVHYIVENEDPFDVWTGYRGQLNQIMLGIMAPDYIERSVFCCGPEPFMQSVRDSLNGLGFDMENYHQESFGSAITTLDEQLLISDTVPDETATARIEFADSSVTAECRETDSILAVAKAAGLNIPSGCTMGICGTCKIRKLSGDVHMVHNGGISEKDIKQGYVLACCSNPIGTISVAV